MKGKSKYIIPLLLAGVTASAAVVPTVNQLHHTIVRAEESQPEEENGSENTPETKVEITDINGVQLRMKGGFETTYPINQVINMPAVVATTGNESVTTTDAGYDIVYKIYKGTQIVKEAHTVPEEGESSDLTFTPKFTGAYNVVITAEKKGVVVTELKNITFMVEKSEAGINLPINSQYVIPAQLPTTNNGLKIPAPSVTVTNEDGTESTKDAEEATGLSVKLIVPTPIDYKGEEDITEVELELADVEDGEELFYSVEKEVISNPGTYQIRYEYRDGTTLISKLETNFQVVNNLKAPTALYLKLSGSVPSKGNVNTEISVPKATVLDSKSSTDGINAHLTITVTKLKSDNTRDESTTQEIDYENYTFKPEQEGNYVISYYADLESIYPGVHSTPYSPSTIIKVTDDANPTVMPTYGYSLTDGKITGVDINGDGNYEDIDEDDVEKVLVNRKADVPTVLVLNAEGKAYFRLPAIYGTDNKDSLEDLEFTREVVGNNLQTITITANPNEVSEERFISQAGNYEIRYKVKDKANNTIRATYPLRVITEKEAKEGSTTVNLNIGVSTISDKETLKFSAPTATDTHDSYPDVTARYVVLDKDGKEIADSGKDLTELNKDGKYEIKISEVAKIQGAHTLRVYASAKVDKGLEGYRKNTVTEKYKDIRILNTSDDETFAKMQVVERDADGEVEQLYHTEASSWNAQIIALNSDKLMDYDAEAQNHTNITKIGSDGYAYNGDTLITTTGEVKLPLAAFDQGKSIITLPEIVFTDADEHLKLTLTIKDRFGNTVTKETNERIKTVEDKANSVFNHYISGASFKLSASGIYTVTYRAEDTAGNVVVKTFGIRVNDKTAPTIVIDDEDKYGVDIEVGRFFEVPNGRLIKDGEDFEDGKVYWDIDYSSGAECEISSTGFTPLTDGTFYITYYGADEYGNKQILKDNGLFYVNAKDTTAPEFNEDSSYILPPTQAWNATNGKMDVDIPLVYATDPIKNESVDVVYTVKSPDGTKVDIKDYPTDSDKADRRYFTASAQGIYTITYEATDNANNTTTMTKEIAIGDCEAPTLTWLDDYKIETDKKIGDELVLKLKYLDLVDNVTTDKDVLLDKMTVTLLKPDGTTKVTNKGEDLINYKWDLTETGAYTLKIVVKDEAGMSNTYKYTINVAAEDAENNVIDSVVGTVLIVVSVVVLAGVVVYFVVSSRKKAPVKSTRKNKK